MKKYWALIECGGGYYFWTNNKTNNNINIDISVKTLIKYRHNIEKIENKIERQKK